MTAPILMTKGTATVTTGQTFRNAILMTMIAVTQEGMSCQMPICSVRIVLAFTEKWK